MSFHGDEMKPECKLQLDGSCGPQAVFTFIVLYYTQ